METATLVTDANVSTATPRLAAVSKDGLGVTRFASIEGNGCTGATDGGTIIRVTAGASGTIKVRLSSGHTTIATGRAKVTRAGVVGVRLGKATRKGLRALRGRHAALLTATLAPATGQRLEQSQSVKVR